MKRPAQPESIEASISKAAGLTKDIVREIHQNIENAKLMIALEEHRAKKAARKRKTKNAQNSSRYGKSPINLLKGISE